MTRHSKNNTALGVFTYAEKQKLKGVYGTLNSRMGRDSQKPFDHCSLCLAQARTPLVCSGGHLFCKECIYNSIVQQRKEIELETKALEAHKEQRRVKELAFKQEDLDKKVLDFINNEVKVIGNTPVDESINRQSTSSFQVAKEKGAFWMPDKVEAKEVEAKETEIRSTPMCKSGKEPHAISLKKLIQVKFNEVEGKKSCPVCLKGLSLGLEISVLKNCGHAICRGCINKFVSTTKEDGGICPVCGVKCKYKQIINLDIAGTGFAAKGQAEAKRATLAFQC